MQLPVTDAPEPTACFDLMLAGFDRAAARSEPMERWYRFGELTARLRFAGDSLVSVLSPALAHLRVEPEGPPDLDVHLWDSASTQEPLSPLLALLTREIQRDPYRWLSPRHELLGISNERVPATRDQWSGVFSVFDRESNRAVYWVDSASKVPYFEQGAPLRTLLSWWLSDADYQPAHAGAVGFDDGGVLLAGSGGSGKSTTALLCLDAGFGYASDDYCMFSTGAHPRAYSMYNTAKLNGCADLERQPRYAPLMENMDAVNDEKLMLFVHRHFPDQVLRSFPIKAVVLPRVGDEPLHVHEVSAGHALRAIGPSTLGQLPGAAGGALHRMAELVQRVPCYALHLGQDPTAVPGAIAGLLGR